MLTESNKSFHISELIKTKLLSVTSPILEALSLKPSNDVMLDQRQNDQTSCEPKETMPRENSDTGRVKVQHFSKHDNGNSSAIHPVRMTEDENLDYDSNASSSSFEFHKGERQGSNPATRSLLRPIPSKWNDAEKWIMNRQNIQANNSKKNTAQSQANRLPVTSMVRVAPESGNYDHHKLPIGRTTEAKGADFCQSTSSHIGFEKFSFVPSEAHLVSGQAHGQVPIVDSLPQSKDLKEVNEQSGIESINMPIFRLSGNEAHTRDTEHTDTYMCVKSY